MTDRDIKTEGKITLDIGLQELLDIVSKSGQKPLSETSRQHNVEGEDLKKAWFKHMLISVEKLNDLVETVRHKDIGDLRSELKDDIDKLTSKIDKNDDELKAYKVNVIAPLNNRVIMLTAKLGVWSLIAGFVGSGLMGFLFYIVKEYLIKSASTGSP